jgi:hypothetical protein
MIRGIAADERFVDENVLCPVIALTSLQKLRKMGAFKVQKKRRSATSLAFTGTERLPTAVPEQE